MEQCCFARKDEYRLRKRKTISIFEENSPPISNKLTLTCAMKGKNHSIYGGKVSTPHWLIQLTKISFAFLFYKITVNSKATWFSQSPTWDQIQLL